MVNKKIEKEQVLNPCLILCRKLLGTHIIKYRRLDALDLYHEKGDPDIEIWVPKDSMIWVVMAECKKPIGGIFSEHQIKYKNKYKDFKNVIYIGITEVRQLKDLIFKISDYSYSNINEFESIEHL